MTEQTMAIIVSVCKHCHRIIEIATDKSSSDGRWEPPIKGAKIEADVITSVKEVKVKNSHLRGYIVELDTRTVPHCESARQAKLK